MKIDVIERFEVEGRGTVFTCRFPELISYKELGTLIDQAFEHKGEKFLIRDIEYRQGANPRPAEKEWFACVVKKV
jgi:hypothetical protein